MNDQSPREIDLQIIADSFRAISDTASWDRLVQTWDRKIADAGLDGRNLSGEKHLKQHYASIGGLLDRVALPSAVDPLDQAVGSVLEPAMALSERLRVAAINPAGRKSFGVEQGQPANLDWLNESYRRSLREFIAAQSSGSNQKYRILRTNWADGREGLVEVYPVKVPEIAGSFIVVRELTMRWSGVLDRVLIEAFGLTQAETEIARLLFLHADIAKVASARGVGIRTTRLQLSSMYAKTETANQVELIRLLVLLATRMAGKADDSKLRWSDPLGREQILMRPDGRRLAYSVMGAEDGTPALYVHGIVNGYLYPDEFQATLEQYGVKLYVMTRPGAGNSDANRAIESLTDHADAIVHLCAELGLRNIAAAGIHASVIPLAAVATRADTPIRAIIAMGRFLPYNAKRYAKIAMMPRTLLWLAVNAPWAADILARQAYRALVQNGVDWYIERAYGDMPFDYQTTKRPEIAALIRNACAFTFLQGPDIFFDDLRMRSQDISPFVQSMRTPFHWMIGGMDVYETGAHRFYDAQDEDEFRSLNPLITFERVNDASELMPYQQPTLVARRIAEAALGRSFAL